MIRQKFLFHPVKKVDCGVMYIEKEISCTSNDMLLTTTTRPMSDSPELTEPSLF